MAADFRDNPQHKRNFLRNLKRIFGAGFSDAEIEAVALAMLPQVGVFEISTLKGLDDGTPSEITGSQKRTLDRIVGRMERAEASPLIQRAAQEYRKALNDGRLKVRN